MIKIEYLIKRDEGDKTIEYKPTLIPTELPNVVYVEGPNSSGKSTLLNIIALAYFGQKLSSDELNNDLRERLNNLVDSEHQKIQFKIEVDNEILGTKFISQKKDLTSPEIVVRKIVGGKSAPISPDLFRKEYKLIYDIPNSPLERLPLLLNLLRNDQKEIGSDVEGLRNQLRKIIDEIKGSRDPELIQKQREMLLNVKADFDRNRLIAEELIEKQKKLKVYYLARFYHEYMEEKAKLKTSIDNLKKDVNKEKRQQNQEHKDKIIRRRQLDECINQIDGINESIKTILPKLIEKDQKKYYKQWADADVRDEINHPDIYQTLREQSKYISGYLKELVISEKQKNQDDLEKVKLLKTLIGILSDYENNDITIPVINLPIKDFITSLNKDLEKYQQITIRLQNIDNCANSLDHLIKLLNDGISLNKLLLDEDKKLGIENDLETTTQEDLEELDKKYKNVSAKVEELKVAIIKEDLIPDDLLKIQIKLSKDEEIKNYEYYLESQLQDKLKDSEIKINNYLETCRKLEKKVVDTEEEIDRLEKKEPHKYQESYTAIQKILKHVQNLEKKFHSFDSTLKKMIGNSVKYNELSSDEKIYSEYIGEYLAKKIKTIRHISKIYEVKNINVIRKMITTNNGKIIHFNDLGTGQGQAAYLDTLLSMSENKKIIALFDEVAMMDESSLKPIKEKLKKLYQDKKLIMAVIVQKGEKVKVESLI